MERFGNILLLADALHCLPISEAELERSFSRMKIVMPAGRSSLGSGEVDRLTNLVRISLEGPPVEKFDPQPVVNRICADKARRPKQKPRKAYRPREKAVDFVHEFFNGDLWEEEEEEEEEEQ